MQCPVPVDDPGSTLAVAEGHFAEFVAHLQRRRFGQRDVVVHRIGQVVGAEPTSLAFGVDGADRNTGRALLDVDLDALGKRLRLALACGGGADGGVDDHIFLRRPVNLDFSKLRFDLQPLSGAQRHCPVEVPYRLLLRTRHSRNGAQSQQHNTNLIATHIESPHAMSSVSPGIAKAVPCSDWRSACCARGSRANRRWPRPAG